jgi:general secretion pathway protein J
MKFFSKNASLLPLWEKVPEGRMRGERAGFTLLEILIALFIFSILSILLASALRSVINAQSGTENSAERLRDLQHALLLMSRDVEQTVNRSIKIASGAEEDAFIGTSLGFTFTHTGFANPVGVPGLSALQRARYFYSGGELWRTTWPVLDQAPQTVGRPQKLLANVKEAHFQYLDQENQFQDKWPLEGRDPRIMPRAVKIFLSLAKWGEITQIYIIPVQSRTEKNEIEKAITPAPEPKS